MSSMREIITKMCTQSNRGTFDKDFSFLLLVIQQRAIDHSPTNAAESVDTDLDGHG